MLHILSGALFISVLVLSIGVIVATIRAEKDSIRSVLGIAPKTAGTPLAYRARVRVIKRAEFRPIPKLQARAA